MLCFVIGVFVGALLAFSILGFMAIIAEDREYQEEAERKREQDRQNMKKIEDWYRSYY